MQPWLPTRAWFVRCGTYWFCEERAFFDIVYLVINPSQYDSPQKLLRAGRY
jgi:hypothetical protein